jgi:hypothetical protein
MLRRPWHAGAADPAGSSIHCLVASPAALQLLNRGCGPALNNAALQVEILKQFVGALGCL